MEDGAARRDLPDEAAHETVRERGWGRVTLVLVLWVFVDVGLPLLAISSLVDLLIQQITGNCTGFWCWF